VRLNIFTPTGLSGAKARFFGLTANAGVATGDYQTVNVTANGSVNFTFHFPHDMTALTAVSAICIPQGTFTDESFTFGSDYASAGEDFQTHSESLTENRSGTVDLMTKIDATGVYSSPVAGDFAGLLVDHNNIGGVSIRYLGILVEYT